MIVQELVPPALPVPLSVLTDDAELGLRQVAGPGRARETVVHSVHTSEMADPLPYLLGGELLLSAGVHCAPGAGGDGHWERYVRRAAQAGAAALGFGIAPVHEEVPPELAAACDRHGLPLVEVPRGTPFTAVARTLWQAVTERRHRALRRLSEAQQTLAAAAAAPHPVPAVLTQLARRLEAWAVLLDGDGAEIASAGAPPGPQARTELASLARRLRPGPSSAAGSAGELRLSVYGLAGGTGGAAGREPGRRPLALGLCGTRRDGIDGAVAAVAVVLLALLTERRAAEAGELRAAALVRLMLGAAPEEAAPLLHPDGGAGAAGEDRAAGGRGGAGGMGGDGDRGGRPAARWVVVHGQARHGRDAGPECADGGQGRQPGPGDDPFATAALAAGLGTTLVDTSGGRLRALVPVTEPATAGTPGACPGADGSETAGASGDSTADAGGRGADAGTGGRCADAGAEGEGNGGRPATADGTGAAWHVDPQPGWTLGVSRPVPAAELPRADAEAARALRRALAERRPLVRQRADGAADAAGVASLVAPEEARGLAAARLAPLDGQPRLVETLRMWLSLNGSWDRTAVALEVHRNTVRQRIARVAALLGEDPADPDVRMELWFALKWR